MIHLSPRHFCLLLVFCLYNYVFAYGQVPVNTTRFNKKSGVQVLQQNNTLQVSWPTGNGDKGSLMLNLQPDAPVFQKIQVQQQGQVKEIAAEVDPVFLLTVGKRDLVKQNGWNIFFDNTAYLPYQTFPVKLTKKNVQVVSDGSQTNIIIGQATAGNFTGNLEITLYNGSPLLNIAAVLATEADSTAIIYDAGLVSKNKTWEKVFWADAKTTNVQSALAANQAAQDLAVKYRTIIGQGKAGSLAVFPAPHQYFYPLDNVYNLKYVWHGTGYRDLVDGYGLGIRHDLLGDRRWVPWFNAPPKTQQRLNFFCLLSTQKDGKVLEDVKKFTNGDAYQAVDGHYTLAAHFHQEHVDDVLTHKPLPELPGFVQALRNTGVNIVATGEFHLAGNPKDLGPRRLTEFKKLFDECARLSNGNFLLLPGEEANVYYGGHWMNFFPKPVYWIQSRQPNQPFVEPHPEYGKVYRVGSKADMLQLLEAEKGIAWTAHARTKGSVGFPDKYMTENFYKNQTFFGAAWKNLPADLSQPRLGKRALDVLDDMANAGDKKYLLGEADLFKIEPDYELYGHMNINYLQLDKMPEFKDGWQPVLDALQKGKFFVSTGEVLLPAFTVNNQKSGETAQLPSNGKATISLTANWTFPLNFAEIISGDGKQVYRQTINLKDTQAFGSKQFNFSADLKNRKWVRLEVWDTAANGAFTQPVWLE
ncbi:hypothetical protein [Adhaeribacter rhizoryzae]|uniref:hypothetical protein n=1 Tax=Adhaeribacter rhizoryzae TaxID=2607907 RepID=UPI001CC1D3E0|nr:hypothetical protein [Adhaeribacter rhizoryzae]